MNDCTTPLSVCLFFVICRANKMKMAAPTPVTKAESLLIAGLCWGVVLNTQQPQYQKDLTLIISIFVLKWSD